MYPRARAFAPQPWISINTKHFCFESSVLLICGDLLLLLLLLLLKCYLTLCFTKSWLYHFNIKNKNHEWWRFGTAANSLGNSNSVKPPDRLAVMKWWLLTICIMYFICVMGMGFDFFVSGPHNESAVIVEIKTATVDHLHSLLFFFNTETYFPQTKLFLQTKQTFQCFF